KAEFWHGYHRRKGVPRSHRFFGDPGALYPMAMLTPGLSSSMAASRFGKMVLKRLAGVHPNRSLPKFASKSFRSRAKHEDVQIPDENRGKVMLMVDLFNDVHDPDVAMAAKRVLEHIG